MIIDEESYKVSGEILEHVGIKGMKWGVRKSKAERMDAKRFKKGMKKHNPKQFTNAELQTIITRMKLEQEYVKLTTPAKTKKTDGFVKTLIKNNAKHAVNIGIKEAMKAYERKSKTPAAAIATKAVSAIVDNHPATSVQTKASKKARKKYYDPAALGTTKYRQIQTSPTWHTKAVSEGPKGGFS